MNIYYYQANNNLLGNESTTYLTIDCIKERAEIASAGAAVLLGRLVIRSRIRVRLATIVTAGIVVVIIRIRGIGDIVALPLRIWLNQRPATVRSNGITN